MQAGFAILVLAGEPQADIGLDAVPVRVLIDPAHPKGIAAPGPGDLPGIVSGLSGVLKKSERLAATYFLALKPFKKYFKRPANPINTAIKETSNKI